MTSPAASSHAAPLPFVLRSVAPPPPSLALDGTVVRSSLGPGDDRLTIRYQLHDPEGLVQLAPAAAAPRRRDALWQTTCFECFLAAPGTEPYWEVNLSPSGDWNVYHLSGYREGLAAEPAISSLPFTLERHGSGLTLALNLDLAALVEADQPLDLAITAVLALADGSTLFWALFHPGAEADFHRREGFVLRL